MSGSTAKALRKVLAERHSGRATNADYLSLKREWYALDSRGREKLRRPFRKAARLAREERIREREVRREV